MGNSTVLCLWSSCWALFPAAKRRGAQYGTLIQLWLHTINLAVQGYCCVLLMLCLCAERLWDEERHILNLWHFQSYLWCVLLKSELINSVKSPEWSDMPLREKSQLWEKQELLMFERQFCMCFMTSFYICILHIVSDFSFQLCFTFHQSTRHSQVWSLIALEGKFIGLWVERLLQLPAQIVGDSVWLLSIKRVTLCLQQKLHIIYVAVLYPPSKKKVTRVHLQLICSGVASVNWDNESCQEK